MILSADLSERKRALAKLLPMQRIDFVGIFEASQKQKTTFDAEGQRALAAALGDEAAERLLRALEGLFFVPGPGELPKKGNESCR